LDQLAGKMVEERCINTAQEGAFRMSTWCELHYTKLEQMSGNEENEPTFPMMHRVQGKIMENIPVG